MVNNMQKLETIVSATVRMERCCSARERFHLVSVVKEADGFSKVLASRTTLRDDRSGAVYITNVVTVT